MKKTLLAAMVGSVVMLRSLAAFAACDAGETKVKFAHVTNTDKHPKGIAATLLEKRVNEEMNGKLCMEYEADVCNGCKPTANGFL